ncbi:hypothetical protein [Massilia sp. ST3]|uniref:hypothetical protein n=1 Tax=Massilia sp. ST3 TaxID=2824903 RepID=UPI001B81B084|nr:hypothetical protein [Massilia sp. ST3]MBQ5949713.1 hypothetical protein [Massilia sp. ST3]
MLPLATYLKLTRLSALYDILTVAPFATPWTFTLLTTQLSHLNGWLGAPALPAFAPIHTLLATLLGTLVLLWSLCRLTGPSLKLGRYDATGRLLFSLWLAWAMLQEDLPVLWVFLLPELLWGLAQWLPVTQSIGSSTARAAFTSAAPMRSSRGG